MLYSKISTRLITEEDLKEIDFPRVPKDVDLKGLDHYLDKDVKERLMSPATKKGKKARKIKDQENIPIPEEIK